MALNIEFTRFDSQENCPLFQHKNCQTELLNQNIAQISMSKQNSQIFECEICMESVSKNDLITIKGCNHQFCKGCLNEFFLVSVQELQFQLKCPSLNCEHKIQDEQIKSMIEKVQYEKYIYFRNKNNHKKQFSECPAPGCNFFLVKSRIDGKKLYCNLCFEYFCEECGKEPHPGFDCDDGEEFSAHVSKEQYQKCPDCKMWVFKFEGCLKMICPCGSHFCYECGAKNYDCEHGGSYDDEEEYYDDEEY